MPEAQLKIRLLVPRDFNDDERNLVARLVIEFIQDRTDKGKDIKNNKFPKYSVGYSKSLDFKLAGKRINKVDLQQTGDTIHSIELLTDGIGFITIGYDPGSEENDKAKWLQASDNGISRKFLGIQDSDLQKIIQKVLGFRTRPDDLIRRKTAESIVENILQKIGF